jgi:hypothetical protein
MKNNMNKPFPMNLQLFAEDAGEETNDVKVNIGDILRSHTNADGVIDIDKAESAVKSAVGRAFVSRARYKAKLDEIDTLTSDKNALEDKLTAAEKWQDKYKNEHDAFEKYKADTDARTKLAEVKAAYKKLLTEAGIDPKRHDAILRATTFDDKKLGEDGKLENADKLKSDIETDWADFKVTTTTKGASVATPPANPGPAKRNKAEILAIKDTTERQRAIAENHDLFGF